MYGFWNPAFDNMANYDFRYVVTYVLLQTVISLTLEP